MSGAASPCWGRCGGSSWPCCPGLACARPPPAAPVSSRALPAGSRPVSARRPLLSSRSVPGPSLGLTAGSWAPALPSPCPGPEVLGQCCCLCRRELRPVSPGRSLVLGPEAPGSPDARLSTARPRGLCCSSGTPRLGSPAHWAALGLGTRAHRAEVWRELGFERAVCPGWCQTPVPPPAPGSVPVVGAFPLHLCLPCPVTLLTCSWWQGCHRPATACPSVPPKTTG